MYELIYYIGTCKYLKMFKRLNGHRNSLRRWMEANVPNCERYTIARQTGERKYNPDSYVVLEEKGMKHWSKY